MPATQSSPDPAQSAKVFAEVAERSSRLMAEFLQRQAGGHGVATSDEFGIARAFMDLAARMLADPWKLAEMQTRMFWDHVALWQSSLLRMLGKEAPPVAEPGEGDNRFRNADWQDQFLFDYIKQSYLIAARHRIFRRGLAGGDAEESEFLHAPIHRCAVSVELRSH